MSQVVSQETLTKLLMEKGIFSKEEFLEIVRVRRWRLFTLCSLLVSRYRTSWAPEKKRESKGIGAEFNARP
jgi:hypothetical protein